MDLFEVEEFKVWRCITTSNMGSLRRYDRCVLKVAIASHGSRQEEDDLIARMMFFTLAI